MCDEWIESVFRHIYSTFSQTKNDFVIKMAWNLFSRPIAASLSDRKNLRSAPLAFYF